MNTNLPVALIAIMLFSAVLVVNSLYKRDDHDAVIAYRVTFDELERRMGDEQFDAWCESVGI